MSPLFNKVRQMPADGLGTMTLMDFLLIVFLSLLNGVFAMPELALASSRKARLATMDEPGDKGA
jgi:putative hemolysin